MGDQQKLDNEFAFIRDVSSLFRNYRAGQTLVPVGDDAAVYSPGKGMGQVVTVDTMVEGVHFKRETMSCWQIGYKALAANLSDIAAMGGKPAYFIISIAIPQDWTYTELLDIYKGMQALADRFKVDLLGGDTVSTPDHLVITITAIGEVEEEVRLLRSQAQAGHVVFVTGPLGHAAAGLDLLLHGYTADREQKVWQLLLDAHQQPLPHVDQGRILARFAKAHTISLNDVSDGLASEANEIAAASGVDVVIRKEQLPVSDVLLSYARQRGVDPYTWVLGGGEDFVLVGTAQAEVVGRIRQAFRDQGFAFYPIGYTSEGTGRVWLETDKTKKCLAPAGYNHFRQKRD
ncbi:thiamine-monophosphate kinase [Caldalkalibacillus uzonensis]|uniref:Thiamine-monophosphate kinase n=1 Tax=Caldalkalibacillus uzonensis TaxID=353224 RepID=A0ABU0CVK2_9BACI|nr:thiamine-phosphate kinase [Caldalkalibacillus uzonensis]MDQ0340446.1 thiamine-monophosphate kinase [Caldalkalibacillus uzonensis]